MSEILYLKFEKNTKTYNRTITLGEAPSPFHITSKYINNLPVVIFWSRCE